MNKKAALLLMACAMTAQAGGDEMLISAGSLGDLYVLRSTIDESNEGIVAARIILKNTELGDMRGTLALSCTQKHGFIAVDGLKSLVPFDGEAAVPLIQKLCPL